MAEQWVTIDGEQWPVDQDNWRELAAWKISKEANGTDSYALQKAKAIVEAFRQLAFGTDNKPADPAGDLSFTQALVNRFKRTGETVIDAFNPEKSVALNSAPVKAAQAAIVGVVKRAGDVAGQANTTIRIVAVAAGLVAVAFVVYKLKGKST
jgi:hypothetical protein